MTTNIEHPFRKSALLREAIVGSGYEDARKKIEAKWNKIFRDYFRLKI